MEATRYCGRAQGFDGEFGNGSDLEEVFNTTSFRREEMATNEEAIKDVQDAQSNLTQAIQILTDFYVKIFSATTACFGEPKLTTEIRWEIPMSLAHYKLFKMAARDSSRRPQRPSPKQ